MLRYLTSLTYMIEIEEKHGQKTHRHSNENPLNRQVPEVDNPGTSLGRVESTSMRQSLNVCLFERAGDMRKSSPKDCGDLPDF